MVIHRLGRVLTCVLDADATLAGSCAGPDSRDYWPIISILWLQQDNKEGQEDQVRLILAFIDMSAP